MSGKNTPENKTPENKAPENKAPQTPARSKAPNLRYPQGCPIEEHQGYGCNCNPIPIPR